MLAELGKPTEAAAAFGSALDLYRPDEPAAAAVALAHGCALEDGRETAAALKAYSLVQNRYPKSNQAARRSLRAAAGQRRPARRSVR